MPIEVKEMAQHLGGINPVDDGSWPRSLHHNERDKEMADDRIWPLG